MEIEVPSMEFSAIKRLQEVEDENRKLKLMVAELSLENRAIEDSPEFKALPPARNAGSPGNCVTRG